MTELTSSVYKTATATLFPTNGSGQISAADIRTHFDNTADSFPFRITGQTAAPTVNDDDSNTAGNGVFGVGDLWIDETNNLAYICVNEATGAASWLNITTDGNVSLAGAPVNNQLAVWASGTSVDGDANLTWDGTTLAVAGNIVYEAEIQSETISYTLALTDQQTIQEIDSSGGAVTITIPNNSAVEFPIGTIINFTNIDATSTISLTGAAGVTLNGVVAGSGNFLGTIYEGVKLYKRATNEWIAQGAIGVVS
jgi:hypothetical protein